MLPGLHNIPAHFGVFFLTWSLWQCLFYSLFIHLFLKNHSSFPPCPSPKPHLDADGEAGEAVVPWWLHAHVGTPQRSVPSLGVSLPRALCWVWPLQTYSFKRETFLFQLCKKGGNSLNSHASILPESAVCVWGGFLL